MKPDKAESVSFRNSRINHDKRYDRLIMLTRHPKRNGRMILAPDMNVDAFVIAGMASVTMSS